MDIEAEIIELKSRVKVLEDKIPGAVAEQPPAQPAPVVEMPSPVTASGETKEA